MQDRFLNVAKDAAQAAGQLIRDGARNKASLNIEQKELNDFVSDVDRGAERLIRETISGVFPDHLLIGEEYGRSSLEENKFEWIIDPLDGTTNFVRGIPHYAVSIALKVNQRLVLGVVYDPAKDEMFEAYRGHGAKLNGRRIHVSERKTVSGSLLSTGVPFNGVSLKNLSSFTNALTRLLEQQTSGIRRLGSAALDLAYVASGRYDGFWEANLKPWDIAAGVLLVSEAGGQVSDFKGQQDFLDSGHIVASGLPMHASLVENIGLAYQGWNANL